MLQFNPMDGEFLNECDDIYFVFLGETFPEYLRSSLALAKQFGGLRVNLLANDKAVSQDIRDLVIFTSVESFYDSSKFEAAAKRISYGPSFRDGFWLKTLERFFVLDQFIQLKGLDKMFHAELDQLLFRADQLLFELSFSKKRGLFFPFHNRNVAVASVFYCNHPAALRSFLDFASEGSIFPNEMALMAEWGRLNPSMVHALPTVATALETAFSPLGDIAILATDETGGVVDAAQLGQWIGGIDPRNVPARTPPSTKFVDPPGELLLTRDQLTRIKFSMSMEGNLIGRFDDLFTLKIYNLHLHSKVHKHLLKSDPKLGALLWQANQPKAFRLPGTRRAQLVDFIMSRIKLSLKNPLMLLTRVRRGFNFLLKRRPSSRPFISGDTFRSMSDHVWDGRSKMLRPLKIRTGDVVFCESSALVSFKVELLEKIDVPITVIVGNASAADLYHVQEILKKRNIRRVFAQNSGESSDGIEHLPLGLENAWLAEHGGAFAMRYMRIKKRSRIFRVMWTLPSNDPSGEEAKAASALLNVSCAEKLNRLTSWQQRQSLSKYAFVASPPGAGLDAHRAWQAMYLGCVPVVLPSQMAEHFKSIGLPIWIVDSYSELHDLQEEDLRKKYEELSFGFQSEKLRSSYWAEKIRLHHNHV